MANRNKTGGIVRGIDVEVCDLQIGDKGFYVAPKGRRQQGVIVIEGLQSGAGEVASGVILLVATGYHSDRFMEQVVVDIGAAQFAREEELGVELGERPAIVEEFVPLR